MILEFLHLLFRAASAFGGLLAVCVAVWVARRSGNWRDSDERKSDQRRIASIEADLVGIKFRLEAVPTKADIEILKSDLRAVDRSVGKVEAGLDRIEQFLMEKR